jgi:hypothetical protein
VFLSSAPQLRLAQTISDISFLPPSCEQLERIQKEYEQAAEAMQKQKADAKRWLLRQQVRLQAQAVEVQWERASIAEILTEDYNQLLHLTQLLEAAERQ